jgi:hypothetical protein
VHYSRCTRLLLGELLGALLGFEFGSRWAELGLLLGNALGSHWECWERC